MPYAGEESNGGDELDEIAAEFGSVLGPSVSVDFSFPDEIEREDSGKYRFLISHVGDSDT